MRRKSILVSTIVFLFFALPRVNAIVYFDDGGIHNIDYLINDDVMIDWGPSEAATSVEFVSGGTVPSPYQLQTRHNSELTISEGASLYIVHTSENTNLTVSGGNIEFFLGIWDDCYADISGGTFERLYGHDNSEVVFSEGIVSEGMRAYENGYVSMTDGSAGHLLTADFGHIMVSGGHIGDSINLLQNGRITFAGSDFAVDGSPVGFGEITSVLGGDYRDEPTRYLTGTLANGQLLDNSILIGDNAKIVLAPEPSTLLLLGFGAVMVRGKSRLAVF